MLVAGPTLLPNYALKSDTASKILGPVAARALDRSYSMSHLSSNSGKQVYNLQRGKASNQQDDDPQQDGKIKIKPPLLSAEKSRSESKVQERPRHILLMRIFGGPAYSGKVMTRLYCRTLRRFPLKMRGPWGIN